MGKYDNNAKQNKGRENWERGNKLNNNNNSKNSLDYFSPTRFSHLPSLSIVTFVHKTKAKHNNNNNDKQ